MWKTLVLIGWVVIAFCMAYYSVSSGMYNRGKKPKTFTLFEVLGATGFMMFMWPGVAYIFLAGKIVFKNKGSNSPTK